MTVHQTGSVSPTQTPQDRPSAQWGFRPDIEGLRAVAVLAVVLFHAAVPGLDGGFVGVDVFFVISGFLITGLLWRETSTTGTVRLRNFYGARARRLLPASAAVGVITAIAAVALLPPLRVPTVLYDGMASALYVGNYWFILADVNYFSDLLSPSPFQHYWSLGVEEQFYLLWPPLIIGTAWLVRRARRSHGHQTVSQRPYFVVLALVAVVSFTLSLVVTYVVPVVAFFSLPTRAWELALGGLVALSTGYWRLLKPLPAAVLGWTGAILIVLACTTLSETTLYPGTAALLPTVGTALVIGAGCASPTQGCGRILAIAPMRAIGRMSYSWYLWHWPVLVLAPAMVGHPLGLAGRLTAVALSAVLAVLTLRWVENPLRFAPRVRDSGAASLVLGGAATAVAVGVCVVLLMVASVPAGRGAPVPTLAVTAIQLPVGSDIDAYDAAVRDITTQVQDMVAASVGLQAVPSNLSPPLTKVADEQREFSFDGCLRTPYEGGQPECALGDTGSATTVALVGDSNAAMWAPALEEVAKQRGWRLELMAKMACPLMDVRIDSPFRRVIEEFQHCEQWRADILARLRVERPALVVVGAWRGYGIDETMTGFTAFDPAWLHSLTRLVQQLQGDGARVLVLGPIPSPHKSVPICLSGNLDDATACVLSRSAAVNQDGIAAEAAAAEAGGGRYADLSDLFCTTDRCPAIVGNTLVYLDVSHQTLEYSRLLAPAIGALADRALAHP
ncbi:acyltransferase family protein [Mycobacterium sp. MS1601]|uniref:acyltransferase family protein n=1 Tax=Mycobacterium sp. MS1601 TaxID=1936029 RepID=UPI0009F8D0B3